MASKHLLLGLLACALAPAPARALCADPPAAAGGAENAHTRALEAAILPAVADEQAKPPTLAEIMRLYAVPGISVAVIHKGRVEWARGWGFRDVQTCEPVTPRTAFQAASISKTVTAVLALRLVERGRMSLDADIGRSLTSWHLPADPRFPGLSPTLRQLLSHTGGTTVHGFPGYAPGTPLPTAVQVLSGAPPANSPPVVLQSRPGEKWEYSGGGYVMVQQAIEDTVRMPFGRWAARDLLRPLGMRHSSFAQPPGAGFELASGHVDGMPVKGGYHLYPELGAASLWTTAADLARFLVAVQEAHAGKRPSLLSKAMAGEMLTKGKGNWGLGFAVMGDGMDQRFGHDGANEGFQSSMIAYVDGGDGVVVLTNGDRGIRVAQAVIRTIAADYGWTALAPKKLADVPLPAGTLDKLAGFYKGPFSVDIRLVNGHLYANAGGAPPERIVMLSPTRFRTAESGFVAEFVTGPDGRVTGLQLLEGGPPMLLERSDPPADALQSAPLFLRGTMNDWSTATPLVADGPGRWHADVALQPGEYRFKIASADWATVDLGGEPVAVGAMDRPLVRGGGNIALRVAAPGTYRFEVAAAPGGAPTLSVTRR